MNSNKEVHMMFMSGGLLLYFLTKWTGEWIGGYFVRNPSGFVVSTFALVVALTVGILAYQNERIFGLATDVVSELKKVSWPTRKETQAATIVVIITSIIAALILGVFDAIWSSLTDLVYG